MYYPHVRIPRSFVFLFVLFISFSCSKDSDLLEPGVFVDAQEGNLVVKEYVVDDEFYVLPGETTTLDVLENDNLPNPENVKIVEITQPVNGEVVIIEEKIVQYIPNEISLGTGNSEETDTFTYTVDVETEEGSTVTEEATVTVEVTEENSVVENGPVPNSVLYWKDKFDNGWGTYAAEIEEFSHSANKNQEYYFYAYYIDGLISMWRATGDNSYLDTTLELIDRTMEDAVPVGNGYLGWPSASGEQVPLWDSYYWRFVATLTRIMYESPNLRATGNYQSQYEKLLEFSEKHIWERYEGEAWHFYRVNTHMASHWARIGMELYVITGKNKYKEVFDNISFGTMVGHPSNLRNQLKQNSSVPSAYNWSSNWNGSNNQDTSHAGALISFWVTAYDNGMYWNGDDIEALTSTFLNVVSPNELTQAREFVNGSGGYNTHYSWLHEWLKLGMYSQAVQDKIDEHYTNRTSLGYVGIQPVGIAALNAKILEDGRAYYPEN